LSTQQEYTICIRYTITYPYAFNFRTAKFDNDVHSFLRYTSFIKFVILLCTGKINQGKALD